MLHKTESLIGALLEARQEERPGISHETDIAAAAEDLLYYLAEDNATIKLQMGSYENATKEWTVTYVWEEVLVARDLVDAREMAKDAGQDGLIMYYISSGDEIVEHEWLMTEGFFTRGIGWEGQE
jgi:hypothetical protein